MKKKTHSLERLLFMSVSFTIVLLAARIFFTKEWTYGFYPWNLFLALIPLLFSRQLRKQNNFNVKTCLLLAVWLLFFPNAPYLITDIFHFNQRPPVPYWFDLLLVISGAWNGLILATASLMQVEQFLLKYLNPFWLSIISITSLFLSGYGVYLGRFLRFNSWDIITKPTVLFKTSAKQILLPFDHLQLWAFTCAFAVMFCLIYFTIKNLPAYIKTGR